LITPAFEECESSVISDIEVSDFVIFAIEIDECFVVANVESSEEVVIPAAKSGEIRVISHIECRELIISAFEFS
jgi:hypothetical protein